MLRHRRSEQTEPSDFTGRVRLEIDLHVAALGRCRSCSQPSGLPPKVFLASDLVPTGGIVGQLRAGHRHGNLALSAIVHEAEVVEDFDLRQAQNKARRTGGQAEVVRHVATDERAGIRLVASGAMHLDLRAEARKGETARQLIGPLLRRRVLGCNGDLADRRERQSAQHCERTANK